MKLEYKRFPVCSPAFKMLEEESGGYEAIPSPFGELDLGGDIIMRGAYEAELDYFLKRGWGDRDHSWQFASMNAYPVAAKETPEGLWVKMQFHSTSGAQDERTKIKERAAAGLDVAFSIGFEMLAHEKIFAKDYDSKLPALINPQSLKDSLIRAKEFRYVRALQKLRLHEVSPVTAAMEPKASLVSAKARHQAFVKGLDNLFAQVFAKRVGREFKDMLTDYFNEWSPTWWDLTDGLWVVKQRILKVIRAAAGTSIADSFDAMSEWTSALEVFDQMITDHMAMCVEETQEGEGGGYDYYYYASDAAVEQKDSKIPPPQLAQHSDMIFEALDRFKERATVLTRSASVWSERVKKVAEERIEEKGRNSNANEERITKAEREIDESIAALTALKQNLRVTVSLTDPQPADATVAPAPVVEEPAPDTAPLTTQPDTEPEPINEPEPEAASDEKILALYDEMLFEDFQPSR